VVVLWTRKAHFQNVQPPGFETKAAAANLNGLTGAPTTPKGSQRYREYITKPPIHRPSGRYVFFNTYSIDISMWFPCFENTRLTCHVDTSLTLPSECSRGCVKFVFYPKSACKVWGHHIHTLPPGLGLEKIRKWLVYTISWCICKLCKYTSLSIYTTMRAPSAPVVVYIQTAVYLGSLHIHQDMYTQAIFFFF